MKMKITKKQLTGVAMAIFLSLLPKTPAGIRTREQTAGGIPYPTELFIRLPGNGLMETGTALRSAIILILTDTCIPT